MARPLVTKLSRFTLMACVSVGVVAPLFLSIRMHRGLQGARVDSPRPSAADVSSMAIGATEYLLTVGLALLGVVAMLLSEKAITVRERLSQTELRWMWTGATFCGLSLFTGFIAHQVILRATADAVVRHSLALVVGLHFTQLLELGIGLLIVATVAIRAVSRPEEVT